MITEIYKLTCLTNLHVGAGDINYSIIDNEVEKDPVTEHATIHSTGVKGAIKDFLWHELEESKREEYKFKDIFGSDKVDTNDSVQGLYKFFCANLLARPFRISNGSCMEAFVNMTTDYIINEFLETLEQFGINQIKVNTENILLTDLKKEELFVKGIEREKVYVANVEQIEEVEGIETTQMPNEKIDKLLKELIGPNYAIMNNNEFKEYDLPIIARNYIEDGKSKNLWYEEIVPHHSYFYFLLMRPEKLEDIMEVTKDKVIQFGGHASIGYGYSKIKKIGGTDCE